MAIQALATGRRRTGERSRGFISSAAFILAACLSLFATGFGGYAQPRESSEAPSELSEKSENFVQSWLNEIQAVRDEHARQPPPVSVAEDLARRARLDRVARGGITKLLASDIPIPERGWVMAKMFNEIRLIDEANTMALKAVLPKAGWFSPTSEFPNLSEDAWLIVQHSPDRGLQEDVLGRMEPLVAGGAVAPREYALLYDRVRMFKQAPQRFASQATCAEGRWAFHPLEDADRVGVYRTALGWTETLEETRRRLNIGAPC
jgi:hypothetical protein